MTKFERIGDKHNVAGGCFNLGLFYVQQKQRHLAREYLVKARALFEEVGDKQNAQKTAQELRRL